MRAFAGTSYRGPGRGGFTLLELLIVLGIMAVVAGTATGIYRRASEHANDRLVMAEMQEIAKAVRQFKADTGYYPKTGPFALEATDGPGKIDPNDLPNTGSSDDAKWFYSPANLYQLLTDESPLEGTGHQLEEWDPETGRGWRGPYLLGHGDGFLFISENINSGDAAGKPGGEPALISGTIARVPGVGDPFEAESLCIGGFDEDKEPYFGWKYLEKKNDLIVPTTYKYHGRPYLIFDLNTNHPYVVSMGPDGEYDTPDDIVLEIN